MTDNNTPDHTDEVVTQVTPDNTDEISEEGQDISEVGKNFTEKSRTAKLADKEAKKYDEFLTDGEIDYDGLKEVYRGNSISDKALTKFCKENDLDISEVKENLSNPMDKIAELQRQVEALSKGAEPTFTDILKTQLEAKGVSQAEFLKYKDEFEEELNDLEGLPTDKAIAKALGYVLKTSSTVKLTKSDAGSPTDINVMSKEDYLNFLAKRSEIVGNDKAVAELDSYEAQCKAKGVPVYK